MSTLDYLIVGAGPSGVQMGYFLEKAGRNYLILEKQHTAGAFYTKFPLHRTMISFNKRFNWHPEPDFNMRHDWNSLISDDPALLFKNYSEDLYPHADAFVQYVADFAKKSGLKIQHNTAVTRVHKEADGTFKVTDSNGVTHHTRCLINATGAVAPNVPEVEGIENATLYKDHSIDRKLYENKMVAIIGCGNTAFEVANHLSGHAAIVHVFAGRPLRQAWQTHFVGDLRSCNNDLIDMHQLKAMHTILGSRPVKVWKENGKVCMLLEEDFPHWKRPMTDRRIAAFDHVIVCTGWKYVDKGLYDETCQPEVDAKKKYPKLTHQWESVSVPDMFFIGASMGANDKKAASGFIHGFRYNVKSLFHMLEARYFNVRGPSRELPFTQEGDLHELASHLLNRVSIVSSLYQLNGFLCDVMKFEDGKVAIDYELPIDYVMNDPRWKRGKICTMTLEYGFKHYDPSLPTTNFIHPADPRDLACAAFLHPIFRFYENGELQAEAHLGEALELRWESRVYDNDGVADAGRNLIMNHLNRIVPVTDKVFNEDRMGPMGEHGDGPPPGPPGGGGVMAWSEDKRKAMKVDDIERTQGRFRCKYANYR